MRNYCSQILRQKAPSQGIVIVLPETVESRRAEIFAVVCVLCAVAAGGALRPPSDACCCFSVATIVLVVVVVVARCDAMRVRCVSGPSCRNRSSPGPPLRRFAAAEQGRLESWAAHLLGVREPVSHDVEHRESSSRCWLARWPGQRTCQALLSSLEARWSPSPSRAACAW
jgi:hypothetical protein